VPIDVHTIEYALCCWQKYERIRAGVKHGKKFKPGKLFEINFCEYGGAQIESEVVGERYGR
jgi:hypothetical protein